MMTSIPAPRVFVAYTGEDLQDFANAVGEVVTKLQWVPIDHHNWTSSGQPTVAGCRRMVESCDVLVVLVAHRYGWVPPPNEEGDGERSITWIEVDHARAKGIPVLPYLLSEAAPWSPPLIEELRDRQAGERLARFKAELRKTLAGFFVTPGDIKEDLGIALPRAAEPRLRAQQASRAVSQDIRARASADPEAIIPSSFYLGRDLSVRERLRLPLPKRILAIDSGGVWSGAALGILRQVERTLQARYADHDFRLAEYFDLIGGTGEGAVVGAALACGHDVSSAEGVFRSVVRAEFARKSSLFHRMHHLYDAEPLAEALRQAFPEVRLGGDCLRTGFAILTTRWDDFTVRPFVNDPDASSFGTDQNLLLCDILLRAMARPIYSSLEDHLLPDGVPILSSELSTGTDPSLQLLSLAADQDGSFRWRAGTAHLMLTSVGWVPAPRTDPRPLPANVMNTLSPLMELILEGSRLQARQIFDTIATPTRTASALLMGSRYEAARPSGSALDAVSNLDEAIAAGIAAGKTLVRADDFSSRFDVRPAASPTT